MSKPFGFDSRFQSAGDIQGGLGFNSKLSDPVLWPYLNGVGWFEVDGLATELAAAKAGTEHFGCFVFFHRVADVGTGNLFTFGRSDANEGRIQLYTTNSRTANTIVRTDAASTVHFQDWGDDFGPLEYVLTEHEYSSAYTVGLHSSNGDQGNSVDGYAASEISSNLDQATLGALRRNGTTSTILTGYILGFLWYRGALTAAGTKTALINIFSSSRSLKDKVLNSLSTIENDLGNAVKFSWPAFKGSQVRKGTIVPKVGGIVDYRVLNA